MYILFFLFVCPRALRRYVHSEQVPGPASSLPQERPVSTYKTNGQNCNSSFVFAGPTRAQRETSVVQTVLQDWKVPSILDGYVCIYICMHIFVFHFLFMYIYMYTRKNIHAYTYIYIYIYMLGVGIPYPCVFVQCSIFEM